MFAWCESCACDSTTSRAWEQQDEAVAHDGACSCLQCEETCSAGFDAMHAAKGRVGDYFHDHIVEPIEHGVEKAKVVKQMFKHTMEQWAEREIFRQVEHVVDKIPQMAMGLFEDPYMPRAVAQAKDRAITLAWPDIRDEIMMMVALTLDSKDNSYREREVPCCLQRWLRYHILPCDRSLWGRWRDPIWIAFTLCSIAPWSIISGLTFLLLFMAIDKSDEYQLLHFILHCKSAQFVSFGVIGGFWGFLDYVGCITLHDTGQYACKSIVPWTALRFALLLGGWLIQNWTICAAYCMLPLSRQMGRFKLQGHIDLQKASSTDQAGGHMWRFLFLDLIFFVSSFALYMILALVVTHTVLSNDWRTVHILFACQVVYGYCSLPFFLFRLPVLNALLTHSWATGYDHEGICCRFVKRRSDRPTALQQSRPEPSEEEAQHHEDLFSRVTALFSGQAEVGQEAELAEAAQASAAAGDHGLPHGVWRPACLIAMVEATQGTRQKRKFSDIIEKWVKRKSQKYVDRILNRLPVILKFALDDRDMPRAVARGKDRSVDAIWPDVHAEIILRLGGLLDRASTEGFTSIAKGPWCVRRFLRYHVFPCDKSFWQTCFDPVWVIFQLAPLIPWHGACPAVYFFIFLVIDKSDEYQLLAFILRFKGMLFLSNGLLLKVVGLFQFLVCAVSLSGSCETDGPGSSGHYWVMLGGWLLQILLVWAAFLLLPCSRDKGRPSTKGHFEVLVTAEAARAGGYIRHLLAYDILCLSGCITAYVVLVSKGTHDHWQARQLLFVCRVVYGYLSLPFFIFTLPVLQNVLTHSVPTAYDSQGRCCRYVGLQKNADPPAKQATVLSLPVHEGDAHSLLDAVKGVLREGPSSWFTAPAAAADPHEDRTISVDRIEGPAGEVVHNLAKGQ